MLTKRKIDYFFGLIFGDAVLFLKSLTNRITFHPYSKISIFSNIVSFNKGSIFLGKRVNIRSNVEVMADGGKIVIHGHNFINRNTIICAHSMIEIEEGVTIGPNVCIYDHDHSPGGIFVTANNN